MPVTLRNWKLICFFFPFFFFLAKVLESDLVASSLSANGRKSDYMEKN